MIAKSFEEIVEADLNALIENAVAEGKTIEYKAALPGQSGDDRREFLKDVSAFANTEGGDLLYGVEAREGIPIALNGVDDAVRDDALLRLENLLRDGIQPRLSGTHMRFIPTSVGNILVIRVARSWNAPHRVVFSGHGHFYARNAAGAYQLDVGQLRDAFSKSQSVAERISNFRAERLAALHNHHTPVPIRLGCKLALHLVPLSAFAGGGIAYDVPRLQQEIRRLAVLGITNGIGDSRINLQGFLHYAPINTDGRSRAYTQISRAGVIEAVSVFGPSQDGVKRLRSRALEEQLITALPSYLMLLSGLEIEPPIYLFVSLVGVSDYVFNVSEGNGLWNVDETLADSEVISLPEIVLNSYDVDSGTALRPALDMVWNAFGYAHSLHYGADGRWG